MRIGLGFGIGPLKFFVPLSGRRRGRRVHFWTHEGCTIRHKSERTAARCRIGR